MRLIARWLPLALLLAGAAGLHAQPASTALADAAVANAAIAATNQATAAQ